MFRTLPGSVRLCRISQPVTYFRLLSLFQNRGYLYYSAGLLSRVDKHPDHQRFMAGSRRKKNKEKKEKEKLKKTFKKEEEEEDQEPVVRGRLLFVFLGIFMNTESCI